jgi:hypothetical protein
MNLTRIARHWLVTKWHVSQAFPRGAMRAIEAVIKAGESTHAGQIRFAVEGGLDGLALIKGQLARERAIEVFSQLRIWDTQHNNGLLIYLLLADRAVEIVADRGIHDKVGSAEWTRICRQMETAFRQSDYEKGVLAGVQAATAVLAEHFPAGGRNANELPNEPVIL